MSEDKYYHQVISHDHILNWTEIYSLSASIPLLKDKREIFRMLNSNNIERTPV